MTKYAGPFTEREAWNRAEAACRAEARKRGVSYPIQGTVVGTAPAGWPAGYGTQWLTAPQETKTVGEYLLEVTPEMEELPEGTEQVDGEDVEVTRVGTERSRDIFPDEPVLAER